MRILDLKSYLVHNFVHTWPRILVRVSLERSQRELQVDFRAHWTFLRRKLTLHLPSEIVRLQSGNCDDFRSSTSESIRRRRKVNDRRFAIDKRIRAELESVSNLHTQITIKSGRELGVGLEDKMKS